MLYAAYSTDTNKKRKKVTTFLKFADAFFDAQHNINSSMYLNVLVSAISVPIIRRWPCPQAPHSSP